MSLADTAQSTNVRSLCEGQACWLASPPVRDATNLARLVPLPIEETNACHRGKTHVMQVHAGAGERAQTWYLVVLRVCPHMLEGMKPAHPCTL